MRVRRAAALCAAMWLGAVSPGGVAAQQHYVVHEGYVCATIGGTRAIAREMQKDDQHGSVWSGVDAVRGQGHDCNHTRGQTHAKVVRHVDYLGVGSVLMHIVEVRVNRDRSDVFILATLE